jgi:SlyX protein
MTTEERLVELEIKMARQEDMADALNNTLYQQQRKIDELEALCSALVRRMKEMRDAANEQGPADEKPPHY